jgi:dihydropteroate synthase
VAAEVAADLAAASARAVSFGIPPERILLDPGFGFGKNADQNFTLLSRLADLAPSGTPLVAGASRKAFLGSLAGGPPTDRLPESLGAAAVAARAAATHPLLLRVHDVEETIRFLAVLARGDG